MEDKPVLSKTSIIAIVASIVILVLGAFIWSQYATLTSEQQDIRNKTGQVWTQIQRANDLLPRLEQQLNTTIALQKDVIDKIAAARSANQSASQRDTSDPNNVNTAMQATMIALRAFQENYPNLGLPELQQGLLDETSGSINRITYARSELINVQTKYNTDKRLSIPVGLFWSDQPVLGENENPAQTLPPSKVGVSPAP